MRLVIVIIVVVGDGKQSDNRIFKERVAKKMKLFLMLVMCCSFINNGSCMDFFAGKWSGDNTTSQYIKADDTLVVDWTNHKNGWLGVEKTFDKPEDWSNLEQISINALSIGATAGRIYFAFKNGDGAWVCGAGAVDSFIITGFNGTYNLSIKAYPRNSVNKVRLFWNGSEFDKTGPTSFKFSSGPIKNNSVDTLDWNLVKELKEKRITNKPLNDKNYELLIYLNAHSHPSNLQMPRVLADLANMGTTIIVMYPSVYYDWAAQGLNSLAKKWGIGIIVNGMYVAPGKLDDKQIKDSFAKTIKRINSYENGEAVIGYAVTDEVEIHWDINKNPEAETYFRKLNKILQDLDPNRVSFVNHSDHLIKWDGRMMRTGETLAGSSVFWANRFAENRLKKLRESLNGAGLNNVPQIAIYGAQGTANALVNQDLLTLNKIEGITLDQVKTISIPDDICDYITVPFGQGFAGSGLFAYDAYYTYTWYSIVDERGRSKEGRREGIRKGMEIIYAAQDAPQLVLKVEPVDDANMQITVNASSKNAQIKDIIAEISYDGGVNWDKIDNINADKTSVIYKLPELWMYPHLAMVRAIAIDSNGKKSLYSVWNVFPWSKPVVS